jgi:lycopene cyclase domain-containing protein
VAEYLLAGLVALALAVSFAWVTGVARLRATWLGLGAFLVLTLVFDAILTGLPIVTYGDATASGLGIGPVPLEDLLYGAALYLVAVAAWGVAPSVAQGTTA